MFTVSTKIKCFIWEGNDENISQYKKEQNWVICGDVDGPRVCHTE